VCVLRAGVRKGLNADVAPILHIGESGGAKVEYESMSVILSEAVWKCCCTKTKECYVKCDN
jgi:hypothetical protein